MALFSIQLVLILAVLLWYSSLTPTNHRHWHDEYARLLDYQLTHQKLCIHNVRNFRWYSETDYQIDWQTRHYDLDGLQSVDLITSVWGNPNIAHTLFSFGWSNGEQLTFSVETRRKADEVFNSIGGFFRQFEMIVIAADEKDIIHTRTNVRHHDNGSLGEDVHIYPLALDKVQTRLLLLQLLDLAAELKDTPRWYHTMMANCTTVMIELIRKLPDVSLPADYRALVSGRVPAYFYEYGLIDSRLPLADWHEKGALTAQMADFQDIDSISSIAFSQRLRQKLPTPHINHVHHTSSPIEPTG